MKSSRIVLINVIVILLLVAGGGAAVYYYVQSVNYISTDNARVEGQAVPIAAPAAGMLTQWKGQVGQTYSSGQTLGYIRAATGSVSLSAPAAGTIVQQSAVVNSVVAPGTPLARMYDLNNLWITANIAETDIRDIKVGQAVDLDVDAFPGNTLTGKVSQIGLATAGTFSLLPVSNTTTNYTRVTQVIPVNISVDSYRGLGLLPGMSVSVRIHK
ncbi:HlyD family secretion protein [Cohnella pontilimi]|uniref:HlyD family secretion protein n=1 Tax=Cohnella pontilimi TaxID=2564100 RepID=A0A4U0FES8_9BACL|nr:efflux RND transporter periplasmic adaptor subunit [Cohnella pontilimi]TJY41822.1 HlyD family secretion protein [Cohnella pontilimi]